MLFIIALFLMVIPFLVTLVLAILLFKAFHQRTLMDVINGGGKFRRNSFWLSIAYGSTCLYSKITGAFLEYRNVLIQLNVKLT